MFLFELGFGTLKNFWVRNTFASMMQLYRHLVATDVFAAAGKVRP